MSLRTARPVLLTSDGPVAMSSLTARSLSGHGTKQLSGACDSESEENSTALDSAYEHSDGDCSSDEGLSRACKIRTEPICKKEATSSECNVLARPRRSKNLQLMALAVGRCGQAASMVFTSFATNELLQRIFQGKGGEAQRFLSIIDTATQLLTFTLAPIAGALMDRYGRKPFLVSGPLIAAMLRTFIVTFPSAKGYVLYKIVAVLSAMPWTPAYNAASADILDPTTDEFTKRMSNMETIAMGVSVLGLVGAGKFTNPRRSMLVASGLGVATSACFALGLEETLKPEMVRQVPWNKLRNPVGSLNFFTKSPELTRLAVLHVCLTAPLCNNTLEMLRRKRFGWGMQRITRQALLVALVGVVAQQIGAPLFQTLGKRGTLVLDNIIGAVQMALNALVADERIVQASAVLTVFRHGPIAFQRTLAEASNRVGAGEGEKAAAMANLTVLPMLVGPNVFSEIFARTVDTQPGSPTLLASLLHCLNLAAVATCLK